MILDVRTLVVLTALCSLLMGGALFLVASSSAPLGRPLRLWGGACLLHACAWTLLALRGEVPDFWPVIVANTLLALAVVFNWHSTHEFAQKRFSPFWYGLVPLTSAFLGFCTYAVPSMNARIVWMSLGGAALLLACGARLWRFSSGHSSRAQRVTALAFGLCGFMSMARGFDTLASWNRTSDLLAPGVLGELYYCANLLCVVLLTFGAVLISHERAHSDLERLATVDALTDVWNRATIEKLAGAALHKARRSGTPVSLVVGDIDHFKKINDTLGHIGGDRALRCVAQTLAGALRAGDHLGRYGGEEFLIVAPFTDAEGALALATRLCAAVASAQVEGLERVTISLGVATSEGLREEPSPGELFRQADAALYAAKAAGRNRVEAFEPREPSPSLDGAQPTRKIA